jgi:uncharacterized protein with PIN domain/sulfur carrier protein ThiS
MVTAEFRFYEELNDFLPARWRRRSFRYVCAENATLKHAIEALGVPHTEVELILVNGNSVELSRKIVEGDRISVYPVFESLDVTPLLKIRSAPLRESRFMVDAHLGALAKRLRLLGFDTLCAEDSDDAEIARRAAAERRILLTRDRELLKRKAVTHGCYIRQRRTSDQLVYVLERLQLRSAARPFTRCVECNGILEAVPLSEVTDRVPEGVAKSFRRFQICTGCERVYWQGSHYRAMEKTVRQVLAAPPEDEKRGAGPGGAAPG